jgi:hypothetical protein
MRESCGSVDLHKAISQLLYPDCDGAGCKSAVAGIHCFKVLTIAGKTIIESPGGAITA